MDPAVPLISVAFNVVYRVSIGGEKMRSQTVVAMPGARAETFIFGLVNSTSGELNLDRGKP